MDAAEARQPQAFLQWVKPPQQARTRAALTRLLDAAEELVAAKGFEDAGIAEIAKRAGSSVGGFYRRFHDKHDLLHALHERFCQEARATADEALDPAKWEGADAATILGEFTRFLAEIFREREGLFRAFLQCGASDAAVRERTERLVQYMATGLDRLLDTRRGEITHPMPKVASEFALRVLTGTLNNAILLEPGAPGLGDERTVAELSRVITCYLGVTDGRAG